ncbi:hypothetical protein BDU57DRAFT_556984 [Ampelomyces quisqualis]|uniref:Phosphatidylethanolamine-binding protein n=1 Tax=Ampelomyces quisqualis TaxID=50730 RepID=A0A6A5QSB0_AMPQU|nr:hypothetical protein BDU57DRAFT_556984 [Ampelomyces quisqualis]
MAFHLLRATVFVATLLHHDVAVAQQSNIVPEDLRGGFESQGTEVQVSFTGEAVNGFKDGTAFDKDAVTQEPTFALGDSSGIAPSTLYTIIMVDTTCPKKRVLHYARPNFKNNFDATNIATQSAALQAYKAPGAFGETGDTRQYSFLMYMNPQRKQIDSLQLPAEGEAFDVKKFQTDNGLKDPTAGVGMVVKLGGTADCGGDQPNGVPDNLPSPVPPRSTATRQPAGGATSAPTLSSSPGNGTSGSSGSNGSNDSNDSNGSNSPASSDARTSGLVGASSTLGAGPAEQTTNAAPGMSADRYGLLSSLFAIAGLAIW